MEFTEEQKKSLKKLRWSAARKSFWIGLKCVSLLMLSNIFLVLFNSFLIRSETFAFLGGVLNAIFIFHSMNKDIAKENDRVKKEVRKILQS